MRKKTRVRRSRRRKSSLMRRAQDQVPPLPEVKRLKSELRNEKQELTHERHVTKILLVAFLVALTLDSVFLFFIVSRQVELRPWSAVTGKAQSPFQSTVTRSFSPASPMAGQDITVTLTINPMNGETFYAIEERISASFTVIDYGDANHDQDPHILRWVYVNYADPGAAIPPEQLTKTYVVQAAGQGDYPVEGEFMFEGDEDPLPDPPFGIPIIGPTSIPVGPACTDDCTQGDIQCMLIFPNLFGSQTCGNFDADSCTEWSSTGSCGTTQCVGDNCASPTYYDFPTYSSGNPGSCINTCTNGIGCITCSSSSGACAAQSETCNPAAQCQSNAFNCGGNDAICHKRDAGWTWGQAAAMEADCTDTYDNECDGECDYDGSSCALGGGHGDNDCLVEASAITVSNPAPLENTFITVSCTANMPGLNSIQAKIDAEVCLDPTPVWNGNVVEFSCNVGAFSPNPKTVTCTVDPARSYQGGTDQTAQITLQQSDCTTLGQAACLLDTDCEWAELCQGVFSTGFGQSMCVPSGSVSYACNAGESCGAACDASTSCPPTACEDTCAGASTLTVVPDTQNDCDLTNACACESNACGTGTETPCGATTCEAQYTGQHLTGTCQNTCTVQDGDDACTPCTPTYVGGPTPGDCSCEPGWTDANLDPADGCEQAVCTDVWQCSAWSGNSCGDRTCTCACPGGAGCTGDGTTHIDCAPSPPPPGGGGSPAVLKGGGGGSPVFGKLDILRELELTRQCKDGVDNEGGIANGCTDSKDFQCGGTERYCTGGVDNDCDRKADCEDPDCSESEECVEEVIETPPEQVFTVIDAINSIFTPAPADQTPENRTEPFSSVADVQTFFGFLNWMVIGLLTLLFLGLIFAQHIRPAFAQHKVPDRHLGKLDEFIRKRSSHGVSKNEIRSQLKNVGWIDEVIDKELEKFKEKENPGDSSTEMRQAKSDTDNEKGVDAGKPDAGKPVVAK